MMHTDQFAMTGGSVAFSVDGVACPDTSSVGVNGQGGIFNCGLTGQTFRLECTTACTGELAIVELKLWRTHALNMYGAYYIISGNLAMYSDANGVAFVLDDADRVFGLGSIWSPDDTHTQTFGINAGTVAGKLASLNFAFDFSVKLTSVISLMHGNVGNNYFYIATQTFTEAVLNSGTKTTISSGTMAGYVEVETTSASPWTGTDFANRRNWGAIVSKTIFLGMSLEVTWTTPSTFSAVALGDTQAFSISDSSYFNEFTQSAVNLADLTFEFYENTGT